MNEAAAVVALTTIAVISPGPDFAMVTRNALTLSRRAGLWTALGIAAGVVAHVTLTLAGLGLVVQAAPQALDALGLAGAGWLIWLGARMLAPTADAGPAPERPAAADARAAFRVGLVTNLLNPKTLIFVISLFSQVVDAQTPVSTRIGYGAVMVAAHGIWFSAVAACFGSGRLRARLVAARRGIERLFGLVLIGFAAALALSRLTG